MQRHGLLTHTQCIQPELQPGKAMQTGKHALRFRDITLPSLQVPEAMTQQSTLSSNWSSCTCSVLTPFYAT